MDSFFRKYLKSAVNTWTTQLDAWLSNVQGNQSKKQVAIRTLKSNASSVGYAKWKSFNSSDPESADENLWSWFMEQFTDDMLIGMKRASRSGYRQSHAIGVVKHKNPDRKFEIRVYWSESGVGTHRVTTEDEVGIREEAGGYKHNEVLKRYDDGACNASITLGLKNWFEAVDTGSFIGPTLVVHEFSHHYKYLLGCFSSMRTGDGQIASPERASHREDQGALLSSLYKDNGSIVLVPNNNFSADTKHGGVLIYNCLTGSEARMAHAADSSEQSEYFNEWLNGVQFEPKHYDQLLRGQGLLLGFDWATESCDSLIKLERDVRAITLNGGVPFRFYGLINLNLKIGSNPEESRELFVAAANGLATNIMSGGLININPGDPYNKNTRNSFGSRRPGLRRLLKASGDYENKDKFVENIGYDKQSVLKNMWDNRKEIDALVKRIRALEEKRSPLDDKSELAIDLIVRIRSMRLDLSDLNEKRELIPKIWNIANKDDQVTASDYYNYKQE